MDLSVNLEVLKQAIYSVRNGIVISDANLFDNPLIYANPAFMEMTGYSLGQIVGKNCRFLQGDDRHQPAIHKIKEAIKNNTNITAVLRNYRIDGSMFWNELTISPVFNEEKKITHFIGIQNDISARKEAQLQINEFYSVVSHELKTPLSSIVSSLSILLDDGNLSKDNLKMALIAKSASNRLTKLIDDILDIKKVEYGTTNLNLHVYKPQEIFKIVIDDFLAIAQSKNIKIISQIHTDCPTQIDLDKIIRVLGNLVSNAIKFSNPNSKINLIARELSSDTLEFSVQDFGIGISKTDQENLFKPFSQVASHILSNPNSSGLGLYICKSLVELHDGTITVASELNIGTTFSFTLPKKLT